MSRKKQPIIYSYVANGHKIRFTCDLEHGVDDEQGATETGARVAYDYAFSSGPDAYPTPSCHSKATCDEYDRAYVETYGLKLSVKLASLRESLCMRWLVGDLD